MVCVKLNNGNVYRVSRDMAATLVAKNEATYSSKGAWKSQGRNYL